jgi:hypothetical protein
METRQAKRAASNAQAQIAACPIRTVATVPHKARMREEENEGLLGTLARAVKRATMKYTVPDGTR